MATLVAGGGEAYPHKFHTTHQIPSYVEAFSSLADGERAESVEGASFSSTTCMAMVPRFRS